jgi:hypothetical protein
MYRGGDLHKAECRSRIDAVVDYSKLIFQGLLLSVSSKLLDTIGDYQDCVDFARAHVILAYHHRKKHHDFRQPIAYRDWQRSRMYCSCESSLNPDPWISCLQPRERHPASRLDFQPRHI